MFFTLFYNIALAFLFLLALPKLVYQAIFFKKYRQSFWRRLGFGFSIPKSSQPIVWIHAVSVGETKAIAALAKRVKEHGVTLIISSITETGHAEAKRSISFADHFVYLPFDFSWIIKPILKKVVPHLLICSETDLWYNFLNGAKEIGASTVLVNGKISERSYRRLKTFSFFSKRLFPLIDLYAVQNEEYKKRFESLGVMSARIHVTGNLKLDQPIDIYPKDDLRQVLGLQASDYVILVGSTHAPEEKCILKALQPHMQQLPNLKILLIPRHPERFDSVAGLLPSFNLSWGRFSEKGSGRITLVDVMGMLKTCLQVTDLAIIGGSFIPGIGGHNIMEPAQYAVPVLFGPFMHNQPDLTEWILKNKGGEQVPIEKLSQSVKKFLDNPEKCKEIGRNGKTFFISMQGSSEKTWNLIRSFLIRI